MRKIRQTRKIRQIRQIRQVGKKGRQTDSQIGEKGKQRIGKGRKEKKRIEQDGQDRWMETWIGIQKEKLAKQDSHEPEDRQDRKERQERQNRQDRKVDRQIGRWGISCYIYRCEHPIAIPCLGVQLGLSMGISCTVWS